MFVFVLGTGRCGSTLVHELLCRHPDTGFVSNVDDRLSQLNLHGRLNRRLFGRAPARDPRSVALRYAPAVNLKRLRVAPSEAWNLFDRQVSPAFSRPCRDLLAEDATPWLSGRLREFFVSRRAAQHKSVFLHKLTGWPRAGLLQASLDETRFIHVIRDGRAVANSWLQMGWWDGYRGPDNWFLGPLPPDDRLDWERSGRSFPVLASLGWQLLMRAFDTAEAKTEPGHWLEVRYEDLVARPEETMRRMLEFAGLAPAPEIDRALRQCSFEAGRLDAFERDLDPGSVLAIERTIADTLRRKGYPVHSDGRIKTGVDPFLYQSDVLR